MGRFGRCRTASGREADWRRWTACGTAGRAEPPYRARLAGAGIGPGTRVGLDGLADLPFTTKQDLWDGYPGASWPSHAPRSCFTTLTKEAMPLLRYRTGDIVALDRSACACGRTLARMSKVTGRRDDMLVIRGVDVDPSGSRVAAEVGAALLERLGLTTDVRVLPAGAPSPGSSWARRSGRPAHRRPRPAARLALARPAAAGRSLMSSAEGRLHAVAVVDGGMAPSGGCGRLGSRAPQVPHP
jgi:hypothetical protein